MNRFMLSIAVCAASSSALAADIDPRPAAPSYDWSGFYAGVMGGYGQSSTVRDSVGGVVVTSSSDRIKGGFAGGTLGYNFQSGALVVGMEADGAWSDMKYSTTFLGVGLADKIQAFGSVTGRFGVAVGPSLFYGKAGYAWAENQLSASVLGLTFSESHLHSGWTAGAGFEYLFAPMWSGKIEYMFADYGNQTYLSGVAGGLGLGATTHSIKAGINFHLR